MRTKEPKQQTLPESNLLFCIFMIVMGAGIASTGTFSKFGMGTWSGPEVRLSGWSLLIISLCGIFYYLQKLQSYRKDRYLLLILFVLSVVIGAALPFVPLPSYVGLLPIVWMFFLLLFGHLLHRTFVKAPCNKRGR